MSELRDMAEAIAAQQARLAVRGGAFTDASLVLDADERRFARCKNCLNGQLHRGWKWIAGRAGRAVADVIQGAKRVGGHQRNFANERLDDASDRVPLNIIAHSDLSGCCGDCGEDAESPGRETDPAAEPSDPARTEISGFAVFGAPVSDDVAVDRFEMWMFKQGPWAACPTCDAPLFPGDVHRCEP